MHKFISELNNICGKYNILLHGSLRIMDKESFDNQSITHKSTRTYSYSLIDSLEFDCEDKKPLSPFKETQSKASSIQIIDRDKLVTGVAHPCDGKKSHNRASWENTLKTNNCVTVGNDMKVPDRREITASDMKGDFNVREALGRATHEVLSKRGHK